MHSCCLSSVATSMSQHHHGPPFHQHYFNQPTIPKPNEPNISSHHHHSRLFYFLTDPTLTNAQTILQAQRQLFYPGVTLPHPIPIARPAPQASSSQEFAPNVIARPRPIAPSISSRPQLTSRPPQPQNTLPGIPMAIAAVDDCCAECCPMAAVEKESAATNISTQPSKPPSIQTPQEVQRPPTRSVSPSASVASVSSVASAESVAQITQNTSRKNAVPREHQTSFTSLPPVTAAETVTEQTNGPNSQKRKRSDADREQMLCKWLACSATFSTLDDLAPHLFKIHLSGRTIDFKCHWESCTVSTEDSKDLFSHLTNHLGQLLHYCRWINCRDRFETFDELTGHLSDIHVGSGRSEYICLWEKCDREGKVFSQRQKVMRHIQTHTGDKPYQCSLCKKRFSEANIITQHLRTHTGEKPYKCPEKGCEKQFSISGALTIHRRVHSGEKPFACKYQGCEKRFSESSNLTKHMRVHTGERPFRCSFIPCGKSFPRADQVARHVKTHSRQQGQRNKFGPIIQVADTNQSTAKD